MKVLSISLDKKILDKESENFKHQKEYAGLVNELHIVIFSKDPKQFSSGNLFIYGSNGNNKANRFLGSHKKVRQILKNKNLKDWLITTQDLFFSGLLGYLLKRKFSIKLHVQVHTDFLSKHFRQESLYNFFQYFLGKFIVKKADSFRAVSERIKQGLINLRVNKDKITVVPICVEVKSPAGSAGRRQLKSKSQNQDKFIFLTVGRLVKVKNIGLQIRAMAEIIKQHKDVELWIVGEGKKRRNLEELVKRLKLKNKVKFWGWQDNLEKFYRQADVFLLTSNYEGWPQVVIQAAFFNLAIIITNFSSAGEFIINNENGIIIPINDLSSLKRTMIGLLEDKELRRRLGENAKKTISRLPDKEQTLKLYKKSWDTATKK